jgi:hypothetical protein
MHVLAVRRTVFLIPVRRSPTDPGRPAVAHKPFPDESRTSLDARAAARLASSEGRAADPGPLAAAPISCGEHRDAP